MLQQKKNDNIICKICEKRKINIFRGSEKNLIKRISDADKHYKIDHIIQLTSDNPFIDLKILKDLVKIYLTGKYDFVSNSLKRTFPIGSDIRIFSLTKLLQNEKKVKGDKKQHTCHYFLTNYKKIRYFNLVAKNKYLKPDLRLTLDYPEDLKLYRIIIKKLKKEVNLKNIIRFLKKNPNLVKINANKKNPYYWI